MEVPEGPALHVIHINMKINMNNLMNKSLGVVVTACLV